MTANDKKTGKTTPAPRARPTSGQSASSPPGPSSPLDLDMEELSGSLLVDEVPVRAPISQEISSRQEFTPFAAAGSYAPPPRASLRLPTPTPPPKHEPIARLSDSEALPVDEERATTENLPTVDMAELATTYEQLTAQPAPAAQADPQQYIVPPPGDMLGSDVELTGLPRGMQSPLLSALREGLRRASGMLPTRAWLFERRRAWALSAMVLSGVAAGVGLAVWAGGAVRGRPPTSVTASNPTPNAATTAPVAELGSTRSPNAVPGSSRCVCTGEPRLIAPNATVGAGIEIRVFGSDVALGFAPNDHHATLVRLDLASLSPVETTVTASADPIRRATPTAGRKGRLGLAIDVDRRGDTLRGRRTVAVDPPIQVGVAANHLAWAPWNGGVTGTLWSLDENEPVEALRGARSESNPSTLAIVFRREGSVWVGAAEGSRRLAPKGGLFRIQGLGPMVGVPAIAVHESAALVVWADRRGSDDPWRLRSARFTVGEAPAEPSTFAPPSGGNGDQAMSPGLAVIPGGRFLLTWTQGPPAVHEVRAITLSADGVPEGEPLSISRSGANAGQGQAAVADDGRGMVAFLESSANGFQVVATPITCTR